MKNLIFVSTLITLLYSCQPEPITIVEVPGITDPGVVTTTVTPTVDTGSGTSGVDTGTSSVTVDMPNTGSTTSTLEPKSQEELDEEAEALDCSSPYLDHDCSFVESDYTFIHEELAVRDGHTLNHEHSHYTDIFDTAKSRVNAEFDSVIGHLPTIIEDNTPRGSFSFAGVCGTSWHDSSTPAINPEATIGTLVHEWGHVWHSQMNHCLQLEILDAYALQREAYEAGTGYEQTQGVIGGDKDNPIYGWNGGYPYQLANEGEYMACNIAAYFNSPLGAGTIQSREHLRTQDPVIFALIERLLN